MMAFYFSLKDANIVAYLTQRGPVAPPRLEKDDLWQFLGALSLTQKPEAQLGFVSSNKESMTQIRDLAERAFQKVNGPRWGKGFAEAELVRDALAELRAFLSDYLLFGLTIRGKDSNEELTAFARYAAFSSGRHGIFLITEWDNPDREIEFLDPFPAVQPLAQELGRRPGMLFWTADGISAYAPLREAELLYGKLLGAVQQGDIESVPRILRAHQNTSRPKRILHLSDLHLGTHLAAENQELLFQRLQQVVPEVDRIVITGDLFDEPRRSYSIHFKNFSLALRRLSKKPVVVVPGNHDQKHYGNVPTDRREIADIEWESVVVDDDMQAVFFCFDSSRDADLARGRVTQAQKRDVAVAFEALANERPELRNYLSVALLHHHPFSFEADRESLINRGLRLIGRTDEDFLRMEDGDEFIDWCARRRIPLIMHGHKHVARHVRRSQAVNQDGGTVLREITAVGCGTSLGAEGKPVSYNILQWDPEMKRWSVTYFADPGDGGGFIAQKLAVATA